MNPGRPAVASRTLARGAVALLAVVALAAGCGSSGRELRPPEEGAPAPTRSSVSTAPAITTGTLPTSQFSLTTTAFTPGGVIPAEYSCNGPSPDLAWKGVPPGTVELVLAVYDIDAANFVHWFVTGIGPAPGSVAKGAVPAGGTQVPNGVGKPQWFGPCPPPGKAHTYTFAMFAMAKPITVGTDKPPTELITKLPTEAIAMSVLTGTFGR